jgi:hypothetical protein
MRREAEAPCYPWGFIGGRFLSTWSLSSIKSRLFELIDHSLGKLLTRAVGHVVLEKPA